MRPSQDGQNPCQTLRFAWDRLADQRRSVSNVVTGLLADGLVEEVGVIDTDAGRPSRLLRRQAGAAW